MESNFEAGIFSADNGSKRASLTEMVSDVWKNVLGLEVVDPKQAFLDLGGDSLSAMLCISRIKRSSGVELAVEDFLMDDSNIENITSLLEKSLAT